MFRFTVLLWLLFVGTSKSAPTDEFGSFVNDGEISINDDGLFMGIVPGSYSTQGSQRNGNVPYEYLEYNEYYKIFSSYMRKGTIMRGLTFNIYNEDMKEAASSLFELIHGAEIAGYKGDKLLNFDELNEDLVNYVFQLNMLYRDKRLGPAFFVPPFITKPNFFVNGETIMKALKLSHSLNYHINNTDEARVDQYYKIHDTIVINSNYSGWNLPKNGGEEELAYFREDISLNSYYYGVHLMHPYWMFHHKLYTMTDKHDEQYYFTHQQLVARQILEKEHLRQASNITKPPEYDNFNPYLVHENGLPFPCRSSTIGTWSDDRAKIKAIDIAIRECMSRGLIVMENTDPLAMTEDNYVHLLTKLVRANFEVGKVSKIVRALFGYGGNGYPYDEYNPAPSLLHHPETSLRDPIYWYMIQYVLNYFTEYKESIDPLYLRQYATGNFEIINADIPKITTYFDYYQFNINRAISKKDLLLSQTPMTVTARQKRLKHSKFEFNFTIGSVSAIDGVIRLFLGPPCSDNCWDDYSKYFELDKFVVHFKEGVNTITWSPDTSNRFSNDEYYNMEGFPSTEDKTNKYNMFKFPENLLIPRGLEKGLNLTLFIMVTVGDELDEDLISPNNYYGDIYQNVDKKPLGFPFNRPVVAFDDDAPSYKFYNITVYHKRNHLAKNGYFSPILQ